MFEHGLVGLRLSCLILSQEMYRGTEVTLEDDFLLVFRDVQHIPALSHMPSGYWGLAF
jgi:hypothetical protein